MITLITGVPGSGKTALVVDMMMREGAGRAVCVDGIKDLTVDHTELAPVAEWTRRIPDATAHDGYRVEFTFEPGTLIVIDEAQRIFRPRPTGSKVPDYVAAFETHRHQGLDFWLLTQHPNLIDANLRKLVGRHIHIRAGVLGRFLYEWSEVGDVENKSARDLAAKRRYKLPRKVFDRYTSAEKHTKIKRRVPMYAFVAFFALLALGGFTVYLYRSLSAKLNPEKAIALKGPDASKLGGGAPAAAPALSYLQMQVPRIEGLAHTAPAYDAITMPKGAPFPASCAASADRCECFTDQATALVVPDALCRQIVAEGLYQPWLERKVPLGGPTSSSSAQGSKGTVAGSSGAPAVVSPETAAFSGSHIRGGSIGTGKAAPVAAPSAQPGGTR